MPAHDVYLEPYFGSGAVFFNKKPSSMETINDIDSQVVNLFRVIREHPEELAWLVSMTPWAREEYYFVTPTAAEKNAIFTTDNPIENARRMLIRMWMAFGCKTADRSGWRNNLQAKRGTFYPHEWDNVPERIMFATNRLKNAQIENQPAIKLISRYNFSEVLVYADPPYLLSTRKEKRLYKNEMSDHDHVELLDVLCSHSGSVILSGYSNELYDSKLKRWDKRSITNYVASGEKRKEVIWINPFAAKSLETTLFKGGNDFGKTV